MVGVAIMVVALGSLVSMARAAPPPVAPINQEQMAENVKKFSEMYKLATQLMNLGGNVLSNVQTSGGGAAGSRLADSGGYGGNDNGVLGEVVRPQFRGVSSYDTDAPSYESSSSSGGSFFERLMGGMGGGSSRPQQRSYPSASSGSLSEYGGGPLGGGSTSQQTTALDKILSTFLGSSFGSDSSSSSSSSNSKMDFFNSGYEEYGSKNSQYGNNGQGSNIQAIIEALSRSGARPAQPEPETSSGGNFLSKLFG